MKQTLYEISLDPLGHLLQPGYFANDPEIAPASHGIDAWVYRVAQ